MSPRLYAFLAAFLLLAPAAVSAQDYPTKPIRFIVPLPPGGGTDLASRTLTQKLSRLLGWTFVVDNKPGAGGNIGADLAAKSAPDGYTLVMGQTSNLAINPSLHAKPPFDPVRDFAPISLVSSVPLVIVVNAKSPYATLADVVTAAKSSPDKVTYASPGSGTVGHLAGELLAHSAGVRFIHIPYKGAGPALNDLIGGQVDVYLSTPQAASGHVKAGTLRAIAVTSNRRMPTLPQVQTVAEAGYPGAEVTSWYGVLAPAGTPAAIVTRLNAEIAKALQSADVRETLTREGGDVLGGTPAQFAALLKSEHAKWAQIVKASGAKVD